MFTCTKKTHNKYNDTSKLKINREKKTYYADTNQMKAGVEILIPNTVDFTARKVIKFLNGYYLIIMGSFLKENIAIFNMYMFNNKA